MRTTTIPRLAGLVTAGCLALSMASCGDDEKTDAPPDRAQLERIIKQARAELRAEDYRGLCATLSRTAHEQLGTAGHRRPTTCPRDARKFFRPLTKHVQSWSTPQVMEVEVDGRRASATVKLAGNRSAVAPFEREGGRWKLGSVAGVGRLGTPVSVGAVELPEKVGAVRIGRRVNGRTVLCPALRSDDSGVTTGGCLIEAKSPDVELTMVTMFGRFLFTHCRSTLRLRVDGSGRSEIVSYGFQGGTACPEIASCAEEVRGQRPGKGRFYPANDQPYLDGIFYNRASVCIDSCVGRFVGDLRLAFMYNASGYGWRIEATTAPSEKLGLGVLTTWEVLGEDAEDLVIRPA